MDPHKLNRMFEQLAPTPEQEREALSRLLHEERKGYPMKKLKNLTAAGIAAILMIALCAAAAVAGIDQRLIHFLGGGQRAQELLAPGAQQVDVLAEDNGATLHVAQVLMDRYSILILSDFTAPEGTVLDMAEDLEGNYCGFGGLDRSSPFLLDQAGEPIAPNQGWSYHTSVLDDGDPLDNHLTLLSRLELSQGIQPDWEISGLSMPATDLVRYDPEVEDVITVYPGDWSCQFPIVWQDMGRSIQLDQTAGQLDGVKIMVTGIYLSPMTLQIHLEREIPVPLHMDEASEEVYNRWVSAINVDRVTLTMKDGQTVPLTALSGSASDRELDYSFQLNEIIDPAQIQTLTLRIGDGNVNIPLENWIPAE